MALPRRTTNLSGKAGSDDGKPAAGAGQGSGAKRPRPAAAAPDAATPVIKETPDGEPVVDATSSSGAGRAVVPSDKKDSSLSSGGRTAASGARPARGKRRTSSANTAVEGEGGEEGAPGPQRHFSDKGIGSLQRRGWKLAWKFALFISMLIVLITALFGVVSVLELENRLKSEIVRSGVAQVLSLNGFAQRVIAPFKGARTVPDFQKAAEVYKAQQPEDQAYIKRILDTEKRVLDVGIFASPSPDEDPKSSVLQGKPGGSFTPYSTSTPKEQVADPKILAYWGVYNGEQCLFFRVPLEEAGDGKVYSALKLILSAGEIKKETQSLMTTLGIFGLLFVAAGVALSFGLASAVGRPINTLVEDMNEVARGDLTHESDVPNQTKDEIGLLAMAFNRMTRNLKDAADKALDSERIASELNTAKAIHAKLMPEKLPQLPGIDIFTAYHCAKEVGGDYYDFIPVGDVEHLALCVADVSGKGIPGSMVMGTTRTILRMMAMNNLSASDVLAKTNHWVARDIKRGMFVTCVYCILNVRTHEMTVASAGHNPLLIWRAATQQIEKVRPNGIALGFDKGPVFNRTVREQKVKLEKGDRVVLYTDGVVESMNEEREEWGDEALDEFTLKNATLPSKEYVRLLIKALDDHKGAAEQHDDITITTFRLL